MSFLHPVLLAAGVATIGIPIAIHFLMRRRRTPVPWAAMRFLIEAYQQQRRRLQLEQLVLLALRCLALLLIALAVARPMQSSNAFADARGASDLYLLVDDSLTAHLTSEDGEMALGRLKREANRILDGLGPADRAGLITLARPANGVVVPASADTASVRRLVNALEPTEARADVQGALDLLSSAPETDRPITIAVLSEFRAGSLDLDRPLRPVLGARADEVRLVHAQPASGAAANVSIVRTEPARRVLAARGEGVNLVRVELARAGEGGSPLTSVTVTAADAPGASRGSHRWTGGARTASVSLELPELPPVDAAVGVRTRIDRDRLEADNERWALIRRVEATTVGVIGRPRFDDRRLDQLPPGEWVRLALAPVERGPIEVSWLEPGSLDRPRLAALDAAVVTRPELLAEAGWTELSRFAREGGLVLVMPPPEPAPGWETRLAEAFQLAWAPRSTPIEFDELDGRLAIADPPDALLRLIGSEITELLGAVTVERAQPVETSGPAPARRTVATVADQQPVFVRQAIEAGTLVYLGVALDSSWTDLALRPAVVPLLQEIVRQGVGRTVAGRELVAGETPEPPPGTATWEPVDRAEPFPPGVPIRRAGVYRATDAGGRVLALVAAQPDIEGSDTTPQPGAAIARHLAGALSPDPAESLGRVGMIGDTGDSAEMATDAARDTGWSVWLFAAALAVAAIELVVARFASHAFREGQRV
ncbi:MAG: BatA domain-containing protein [Planctomycetota bacterium]